MKLLIVDDHVLFREGLVALLSKQPDICVVGEAGNVHQAIEQARALRPDVILLDYSMPDGTGLDAARVILAERPETQIVILSMHDDDESLLAAVRLGVKGYLLKNIPTAKLVAAVRGMLNGEAPLSREMTARLMNQLARSDGTRLREEHNPLSQLTAREMEVLAELSGGLSNQEIAARLVVSENTVRNHVHNILEKLALHSRREAGALGKRYGMQPAKETKK